MLHANNCLHAPPSASRQGFTPHHSRSFTPRGFTPHPQFHAEASASRRGFTPHPQLHAKASRHILSFTPRLHAPPSASRQGFPPHPQLHTEASLPPSASRLGFTPHHPFRLLRNLPSLLLDRPMWLSYLRRRSAEMCSERRKENRHERKILGLCPLQFQTAIQRYLAMILILIRAVFFYLCTFYLRKLRLLR